MDFREHSAVDSFDDLLIDSFGGGADTRIRVIADTDDFIVLVDVNIAQVSEADFLF